jgi:hypothetical protein
MESLEETTETFASEHTSRNGKDIRSKAGGVAQHPGVVDGQSDSRGDGVDMKNDESESCGIPNWHVTPVFLGDEVALAYR